MSTLRDLAGRTLGPFLVLERAENHPRDGEPMWRCRCVLCGIITLRRGSSLRKARMCMCQIADQQRGLKTRHGKSRSRVHNAWSRMKGRCSNPNNIRYDRYGGRGIKVCERWLDPENGFENFYADMGEPAPGQSLNRKDNDGDYEPSNCEWADAKTQARNRRTSRVVTAFGREQTIAEWAEEFDMPYSRLLVRLDKMKMSLEQALLEPSRWDIDI